MMPRLSSTRLLALLGAATSSLACVIPTEPLSNNIPERFSILVQNPNIPLVHNYIMNYRANGDDEHLVLRPNGVPTGNSLYLENGLLHTRNIHAVIDLEYDDRDDTTKMFMTERSFHPAAVFQPVYGCDPDTDALQIRLQLVSRQTTPPVVGGQIGIREVVGTYEFRYSPPNNPLLTSSFMPINMVIFRDGPPSSSSSTTSSSTTSRSTTSSSTTSSQSTTFSTSTTTTSTTSTTTTTTTTTSRSSTTATATPTNPPGSLPPVGKYNFVSCWAEPPTGRALPAASTSADDMTLAKCAAFCSSYPYFGTQWSRECFCDEKLTEGSAAAPLSDCSYPCTGDATEKCGGSRRLSLYHDDSWTGPEQPADIGDYELYGCVTDSTSQRTLTAKLLRSDTMTLETCATFCSGYKYFGAEYGIECFCGNVFTAGATQVDIGQCSKKCGGNANQLCGNGDRLSVYQLIAP